MKPAALPQEAESNPALKLTTLYSRVIIQPFLFAFTTPQTIHPTSILARLWLTRLRTAVRLL